MRVKELVRNGAIGPVIKSKNVLDIIQKAVLGAFPKRKFGGVALDDINDSFGLVLFFGSISISLFFYVIYTNTISAVEQKTLSHYLINNANIQCAEIAQKLPYQLIPGSYDGLWATNEENNDARNIVILGLKGAAITYDDYRNAMQYFATNLKHRGNKGRQRNSLWSLMQLSIYADTHGPTNLDLYFNVEAPFFLNTLINRAALVSGRGVCLGYPNDPDPKFVYGTFNTARAAFELGIPLKLDASSITDVTSSRQETCPNQGNWTNMGFNPESGGTTTSSVGKLSFDVRSTFLAVSLNTGMAGLKTLQIQTNPYLRRNGLFAVYDSYYNNPPLSSIICVNQTNPIYANYFTGPQSPNTGFLHAPQVCFLTNNVKNNVVQLFYPIATMLQTLRDAKQKPVTPFQMKICLCPRDKYNQDCNKQSFFFGYFYATDITWATQPGADTIRFGIEQYLKLNELFAADPENYDVKFFDSFTGVFSTTQAILRKNPYGVNATLKDLPGQTLSTQLRDAWTGLSEIDMSMAYFRALEFVGAVKALMPININGVQLHDVRNRDEPAVTFRSDYYFPEQNDTASMCQDFLSIPNAWKGFANVPPVDFTESYYTCTKSIKYALQTSVGNAFATTSLFFNLAWPLTGFVAIWLYTWSTAGSHRTVRVYTELKRLSDELDKVKQESLHSVLESLLARLDAVQGHSEPLDDHTIRRFRLLFDSSIVCGDSQHMQLGERETLDEICRELVGRIGKQELQQPGAISSGDSSLHQQPLRLSISRADGNELTDSAFPSKEFGVWTPRRKEGGNLRLKSDSTRDLRSSFAHQQQLASHPLAHGSRVSISLADRKPRDRTTVGPRLSVSSPLSSNADAPGSFPDARVTFHHGL